MLVVEASFISAHTATHILAGTVVVGTDKTTLLYAH